MRDIRDPVVRPVPRRRPRLDRQTTSTLFAARGLRARARRAQPVELVLELELHPALDRLVIDPLAHRIGKAGLVERDPAVAVVVVLVALGIAELLHQLGW